MSERASEKLIPPRPASSSAPFRQPSHSHPSAIPRCFFIHDPPNLDTNMKANLLVQAAFRKTQSSLLPTSLLQSRTSLSTPRCTAALNQPHCSDIFIGCNQTSLQCTPRFAPRRGATGLTPTATFWQPTQMAALQFPFNGLPYDSRPTTSTAELFAWRCLL